MACSSQKCWPLLLNALFGHLVRFRICVLHVQTVMLNKAPAPRFTLVFSWLTKVLPNQLRQQSRSTIIKREWPFAYHGLRAVPTLRGTGIPCSTVRPQEPIAARCHTGPLIRYCNNQRRTRKAHWCSIIRRKDFSHEVYPGPKDWNRSH